MLSEICELLKPNLKSLIWSTFTAISTGILLYYFSRWRNKEASLNEKKARFSSQKKAAIMELKSNQRGNRGDQKHPFDVQQLSKLLSLDLMGKYPKEFEVLTNLKVDMATLNNGGRVQNCVPGDIRWDRINQAIELIEKLP